MWKLLGNNLPHCRDYSNKTTIKTPGNTKVYLFELTEVDHLSVILPNEQSFKALESDVITDIFLLLTNQFK